MSYLKELGKIVKIDVWSEKWTDNQRKFIHVCFDYYGAIVGLSSQEAKVSIKRALKYYYEKNGQKFLTSTSSFNKDEADLFLQKFKKYWEQSEIEEEFPDSDRYKKDTEYRIRISNKIMENKKWLEREYD
jgi:alpha-galactosidase/6-phospho-beta-glucosidase family protein